MLSERWLNVVKYPGSNLFLSSLGPRVKYVKVWKAAKENKMVSHFNILFLFIKTVFG